MEKVIAYILATMLLLVMYTVVIPIMFLVGILDALLRDLLGVPQR